LRDIVNSLSAAVFGDLLRDRRGADRARLLCQRPTSVSAARNIETDRPRDGCKNSCLGRQEGAYDPLRDHPTGTKPAFGRVFGNSRPSPACTRVVIGGS